MSWNFKKINAQQTQIHLRLSWGSVHELGVALLGLFSLSLICVCIEGRCLTASSDRTSGLIHDHRMTKNSASVPQLIRISFKDDVNDVSLRTTARTYEAERNIWWEVTALFHKCCFNGQKIRGRAESTISEARGRSQRWRSGTMDEGTIKTPIPKCRLYWCFVWGGVAIL